MGACCSCQRGQKFDGFFIDEDDEEKEVEEEYSLGYGDCGARVRVRGSSKFISMFSQQGRKGINQDAMTVWENFVGEKDAFFCGVFDGHGPSGHKVARFVRDVLPSRISEEFKQSQSNASNLSIDVDEETNSSNSDHKEGHDKNHCHNLFYTSWKARLIKAFEDMDKEVESNSMIESYCSGTTTVALLKQGHNLLVANLGDSRAVLCTRGNNDQLVPVQLTVDLKPNLPEEAERIRKCSGRVLAMEEEPKVFRVWMPEDDCPGLAMARAFGDFCLKDFGIISTPQVFYRRLTNKDEFVVLATDGVWDVLKNDEVIRIVASARKRSMAAKLLVERAVRAWRYKYPNAKTDDCAVVCLFLKRQRPVLTKSMSETTHLSLNYSEQEALHQSKNMTSDDGLDTVLNCDVNEADTEDQIGSQADSTVHSLAGGNVEARRRRVKDVDQVGK